MGKPLISDAQMRAMHTCMLRLREIQRRPGTLASFSSEQRAALSTQPIALLAATLLQLRTEDVLVTQGDHPLAAEVLAMTHTGAFDPQILPMPLPSFDRNAVAAIAVGHAFAQSHHSRSGDAAPVTVALLADDAPTEEAMRIAGEHLLPLLLIIREHPGRPRQPAKAPKNVEIVPVDAEDAVACCRVMQESLLRARNRWGSVVLRAVTLPGTPDPIDAFQSHLVRRGLAV